MKSLPFSNQQITQEVRRPQFWESTGKRIVVEEAIDVDIKKLCEEHDVVYIPEVPILQDDKQRQTILYFEAVRSMVDQLFAEIDPKTRKHLDKVGKYTEFLLTSEEFRRQIRTIIEEEYQDQPLRQRELEKFFDPTNIEKVKCGMNLHDIGKLNPRMLELINSPRKLSLDEKLETMQHTAVLHVLDEIQVYDSIIRQIAPFHHAPSYWGADPFREDTLNLPNHAIAYWDKVEDKEGRRENVELNVNGTNQPITLPYAHEYLPLHVIFSEVIDIFDAMTEPRPYRKHEPNWFRKNRRASRLHLEADSHFSIEKEINKRCSHDRKGRIAHLILTILNENWQQGEKLKEKIAA